MGVDLILGPMKSDTDTNEDNKNSNGFENRIS
jgi:hypothetical protein